MSSDFWTYDSEAVCPQVKDAPGLPMIAGEGLSPGGKVFWPPWQLDLDLS